MTGPPPAASRLRDAAPISRIPKLAESTCAWWMREDKGVPPPTSRNERMSRLNRQLPKMSPAAKSGRRKIAVALAPLTSSGRDVIEAIRMMPTQVPPSPDFSAITSPYRDSFTPVNTITAEHPTKAAHTCMLRYPHMKPARLLDQPSD